MRLSMEKPLPPKAPAVVNESIANMASRDASAGAAKKNDHSELEPIENYKGKSLEELEAILDAHNAAQAKKKVAASAMPEVK